MGAADDHAERHRAHRRRDGRRRGPSRCAVHGAGPGAPHLPDDERRQELARGRLQPAHEDDVLRDGEHVLMDDVGRGDGNARDALCDQHRQRDRTRCRRQSRHAARAIGRDGQGRVALRPARGAHGPARDRRRPRLRRRRGGHAARVRRRDRESALGDEPRRSSHGPPRDVRRGRQTVRGRQHGPLEHDGRARAPHTRGRTARQREQAVRVRTGGLARFKRRR